MVADDAHTDFRADPLTQQTQGNSDPSASGLSLRRFSKNFAVPFIATFATAIRQHGFLPRRSTETNLLSVEETVTRWLDEGVTAYIVYLDFAKAFYSVNRRLLLT